MDNTNYVSSTGAKGFIEPDEHIICGLKNGIALNLLSGEGFTKEDAVVTNKRLYYNGKVGLFSSGSSGIFNGDNAGINLAALQQSSGSGLSNYRVEEVVDLEDITEVNIVKSTPWGIFIWGVFMSILDIVVDVLSDHAINELIGGGRRHSDNLMATLAGRIIFYVILSVVMFVALRKTYLRIAYPTSKVCFSVKKYGYAKVREFQRAIFAAKDDLKKSKK